MQRYWREEFPRLVSDGRFVERTPSVLAPLTVSRYEHLGDCTGVSVIDSTALAVCRNARIGQHRVFAFDAARGKTSVGWCYGFTRRLVVNDRGELLAFCLTRGAVDDRRPVPRLVRRLFGKRFGDRGSRSQALAEELFVRQGRCLITTLRTHMRNRFVTITDKLLVRQRAIIETLDDQLKHSCPIEHSRHRRPRNFLVNLLAGLIASCHQPKKPSLDLRNEALPSSSLLPN